MASAGGPCWTARQLESWCKEVLLRQTLCANATVADLCCGSGSDLGKLHRCGVAEYGGVDSDQLHLAAARMRWQQKNSPFRAVWVEEDALRPGRCAAKALGDMCGRCDAVLSMGNGVERSFAHRDQLQALLANASALLRPGGVLVGVAPDGGALWSKAMKAPELKTSVYALNFNRSAPFEPFGCKYRFRPLDTKTWQTLHLVHFPSMVAAARKEGLECTSIINMQELFEVR